MESRKSEALRKIEEKGLTLSQAAEKIGFNPELLKLYFTQDAYPVPKRIIDKLAEVTTG